jgi:LacI family transcriptional regulator
MTTARKTRTQRQAVTVTISPRVRVSRATVSLVLRGSPLVHADTRARVEAELKRQRYVYNRAAANLRRQKSSSIALVINDLSNPFFAEFAAGVDEALGGEGYVTLLGSTGESPERQQAVLRLAGRARSRGHDPLAGRAQRRAGVAPASRRRLAGAGIQPRVDGADWTSWPWTTSAARAWPPSICCR